MDRPVAPAHPSRSPAHFLRRYSVTACFVALSGASNLALLAFYSDERSAAERSTSMLTYVSENVPYMMLLLNILLLLIFYLVYREYIAPAKRIIAESGKLGGLHLLGTEMLSFRHAALEFSSFVDNALILAHDREKLTRELSDAHTRIKVLMHSQQGMCHQTLRESQHLFTTIDAYADYLEELVVSDLVEDVVRYDYDEVTEAAQNLRFLIQGMTHVVQIETHIRPLKRQHTDISLLLGRYLMHLTPVLERRAMRVSSLKCSETLPLTSDESVLGHILWAMLTTCLHYAENDTCLHIEGYSSPEHVQLRFFVNVSSPSALSQRERDAYLKALASSEEEVHMFHHTMLQYPNMQLAFRLAEALGGMVACIPEGDYRCVLSITLPHHISA